MTAAEALWRMEWREVRPREGALSTDWSSGDKHSITGQPGIRQRGKRLKTQPTQHTAQHYVLSTY